MPTCRQLEVYLLVTISLRIHSTTNMTSDYYFKFKKWNFKRDFRPSYHDGLEILTTAPTWKTQVYYFLETLTAYSPKQKNKKGKK